VRTFASVREQAAANVERWTLWAPVAAGVGAGTYFGLRFEPAALPVALAFAALLAAAVAAGLWGRRRDVAIACVLLAFGAGGFGLASLRTHLVAAPVAPAGLAPVQVEGWVVDVVSSSAERQRLLIAPTWIEGLAADQVPARIRVTVREGAIGPGMAIRTLALLNPPPPPSAPGAYDFARDAWFDRIGGSGLALRPPQVIALAPPPASFRLGLLINQARWSLARRLVERMGPRTGGFAAALVTGHQAWLAEADIEAMRASGLAHILSISGVHMAIVGGFVFAGLRLGVAACPPLALRAPGKKIAAAGALAAVLAYLLVSGWPPPAQRAAITAAVASLAVLLDRRALTLHSLAVAALVVLAFQPEAVTQPGFQMSFAATAALLAVVEIWPRPSREIAVPWPIALVQRIRDGVVAGFFISLVAGLATGPFAIQHFNRVTLWGLPANLATEALSSFVVLSALAVGAVGALLGGGQGPLDLADWGLSAMTRLAHLFAGLPHAQATVTSAPAWALPASFIGLLFVCLWRGWARWLGLPFAAAVLLAPRPPVPALWIAPEGANAAVAAGGEAVPLRSTQAFAFDLWARRRGLEIPADAAAAASPMFACDRSACTPLDAAPVRVAAWWRRSAPPQDDLDALCRSAEVVVLRKGEGAGPACAGKTVIGERALAAGGAAELYRTGAGWRIAWAQTQRGARPWSTRPSGGDE